MHAYIFAAGLLSALPLLALLAATLFEPRLGIWPTPVKGTWQSLVFWLLFRTLNTATFALGLLSAQTAMSVPWATRGLGLIVFGVFGLAYLYTLFALGRTNTYCRRGGLVTDGIYRWTRNPQYATIIPSCAGLAVAADAADVYLLAGALIGVYVLMARAEEPWLSLQYGEAYQRYAWAVPRFFNFRRAWLALRAAVPHPLPVRRLRRTHKP